LCVTAVPAASEQTVALDGQKASGPDAGLMAAALGGVNTTAECLCTTIVTCLGVAAGLAEDAASRLANADALDPGQRTVTLDEADRAGELLRQLLARLRAEGELPIVSGQAQVQPRQAEFGPWRGEGSKAKAR
jgi:hypothetical protein